MALPLLPLIGLAAQYMPDIIKAVAGDKAGKVAGQVAEAAQAVFGTDDPDAIQAAIAKDSGLALQWQMKLADVSLEAEKLRYADIASARSQTVELAKMGSAIAWGAPIISCLVLGAFGAVLWLVLTAAIPEGQKDLANILLGNLSAMAAAVVAYWVGSSAGSARKDGILRR